MRTRSLWILVLPVVLIILSGCQPIQPVAAAQSKATGEESFIEVAMAFEQAYQDEDLEKVISFYADDAISRAPGFPTDVGKDAIKVAYESFFDAYDIEREFQLAGVEVLGDHATRFGEWTQVLTPVDGGEPITEVGRCIVAFEKVDGEWKVAWEIWNTY